MAKVIRCCEYILKIICRINSNRSTDRQWYCSDLERVEKILNDPTIPLSFVKKEVYSDGVPRADCTAQIISALCRKDCQKVVWEKTAYYGDHPCTIIVEKIPIRENGSIKPKGVLEQYMYNDIQTTAQAYNDYTQYSQPNALYRTFQVTPEKVIFNDPATIVFWKDGTKTVVKCMEGDTYNPEVGLAMCVCKKVFDKKYHKFFKYYVPKEPTNKEDKKKEEASLDEIYDKIAEMTKEVLKTDKSFLEKFASRLFGEEENKK